MVRTKILHQKSAKLFALLRVAALSSVFSMLWHIRKILMEIKSIKMTKHILFHSSTESLLPPKLSNIHPHYSHCWPGSPALIIFLRISSLLSLKCPDVWKWKLLVSSSPRAPNELWNWPLVVGAALQCGEWAEGAGPRPQPRIPEESIISAV